MDYVYNVLSVLVLLTRTIGIGLIALLSPKVLLGSVRKDIIFLIMGGGGMKCGFNRALLEIMGGGE